MISSGEDITRPNLRNAAKRKKGDGAEHGDSMPDDGGRDESRPIAVYVQGCCVRPGLLCTSRVAVYVQGTYLDSAHRPWTRPHRSDRAADRIEQPGARHGVTSVPAVIVVLCGGVGAARFLRGLLEVVPAEEVTAVVNVGDDCELHGLHISPDIDTIVYTLSGAIDPERGWGLEGETWRAMEGLARYAGAGAVTWFNLGDQDLATHLWRTGRRREGATTSEVTRDSPDPGASVSTSAR